MPSLQDLLDADKPYFGNPNITKQGQKSTKLAQLRDVNTLPDPKTYAFISGLAGTAPDEMGFSVLHPDAENIKKSAEAGYALSLISQLAPLAPKYAKIAGSAINDAMVYGAGPLAKITPQPMRMFVGESANNWNKKAAEKFLELEKKGIAPADAWKQTGTFRSLDGRLRQELSDLPSKGRADISPEQMDQELNLTAKLIHGKEFKDLDLKSKNAIKNDVYEYQSKLPSNLVHPELYKAYPSLKNIESTGELTPGAQTTGKYYKTTVNDQLKNESISGNAPDLENLRSTLLHEAQHAIQQREGWGRGGSPTEFNEIAKQIKYHKDQFENAYNKRITSEDPIAIENAAQQMTFHGLEMGKLKQQFGQNPMDYYSRLLGEAESRATEARRNMTLEERQNTFPLESYDVPAEKLLVNPNLNPSPLNFSVPIPQDPHAPNYLEDVHKALSSKFEYPREQPFKIAQQEAEKIGQSADPYTRSLQQGYEHGWYHGTTGDITNYNPQLLGEATNAASAKKGFFFARDPQNPPASMVNNIKDKDILEFLQQGGLTPEEIAQSASMKGHGADTASGYSMLGGSREYREAMRKAKSAEKQGNWDEYDKQMQIAEDSEIKRSNYLQGLTAKYGDARDTMTEKVNQTFYNLQHPQAQAELLDQKYKELMPYGWYNSYTTQQFDNLKNEITNLVGKDSAASALKEIDKFKAIKAERMAAEKTQEGGNVMPVALSYKNPLVHDFEGKAYREESYSDLVDKAKRNGNDALILKNTFDPGAGPAKLIDVGVVFDPSQIRGKFAAFDPTQSSSTNILAGVVPLSLGGAALGTSNDDVHSPNYLENLHKQLAQKPIDVTDVHAPNYLEDIHNQLANQQ